ncbi:MAG: Ig-like domain-containing protein, partial [Gemmatimonadetes bacterium]|nr:Ig-like domain-containing protein [Gemmatimonadota bacterium]
MSRTHPVLARIGAAAAALASTVACFGPEQPAAITVSPSSVTMDALGDTKQLSATATDKEGQELTGVIFTWASSAPTVVGVDSAGKITALAPGTSDVTATAGGVTGAAEVTVTQVISKVEATSGAQQTGTVGQTLPQQLVVRVRDRLDHAVPGAPVTFTVQANGGTVEPASGTTGADGQLTATWTLGATAGNFQATANVAAGAILTAVFNAKANPGPANNLAKAAGDNQFGFKTTKLAQPVAVRVRDQYGNGVPSHAVQFTTSPGNGSADSSIVFTDSTGIARSGWVMPDAVDTVTLQVSALSSAGSPLLGSPATFTAISHNVRVTGWSPTTLSEGQSATLTGSGFDAGNTQNLVTIDGVAGAVTAATTSDLTVTVPSYDCKPARGVAVQVTVAGIPAAPVTIPLNPAMAALNLSVGQQTIVTDPAQFCFQFGAQAAQEVYLIGVQSTSEVASNLTPITLVGTAAGSATAAPARSAPAMVRQERLIPPQTAERLERWRRYRAAEAKQRASDAQVFRQLAGGLQAPGLARAPAVVGPDVQVGDNIAIRVTAGGGCTNYTEVNTAVRAKGTNGIFLEDLANPAFYSADQFTAFRQQYDDKIYPADTTEFGAPADSDANGRIVIVVTKEVNKRGSLGFTTSCDLFPRDANHPASNEGEFFYVAAPDPNGAAGPAYSLASATEDFPNIVAHESVHVIQFGRRQAAGAAQFLDLWTAEGQAMLGEEIVGHAVLGNSVAANYGLDR